MFIYKITNKINNKIYIGQVYNKTIYDRFARHCKEANPKSKSYIGRAIHKYGPENFVVEEIDNATSLKELNEKEIYWIAYYNSTNRDIGYNLTKGGDGGNTYLCKTDDEMNKIKNKISLANKGINNANHFSFKGLNIKTNEIIYFDTVAQACKYFNIKTRNVFRAHYSGKAKSYWRNEWTFANLNDEFSKLRVFNASQRTGQKIKITNIDTNNVIYFDSQNKCNEFFNCKSRINYKRCPFVYNNYLIEKI